MSGFRDFDLGCVKEMIVWIRYDSKFDFRIRVEAKRPGDKYYKMMILRYLYKKSPEYQSSRLTLDVGNPNLLGFKISVYETV